MQKRFFLFFFSCLLASYLGTVQAHSQIFLNQKGETVEINFPVKELIEFSRQENSFLEAYFAGLELLAAKDAEAKSLLNFARAYGLMPDKIDLNNADKSVDYLRMLGRHKFAIVGTSFFAQKHGLKLKDFATYRADYRLLFLRTDSLVSPLFKGVLLLHELQHVHDVLVKGLAFADTPNKLDMEARAWLTVIGAVNNYTNGRLLELAKLAVLKEEVIDEKFSRVTFDPKTIDILFPPAMSQLEKQVRLDLYNESSRLLSYINLHGRAGLDLWKQGLQAH